MAKTWYLVVNLLAILIASCYPYSIPSNLREQCPRLYGKTFKNSVPRGNLNAGVFEEIIGVSKLKVCVLSCCLKETCNVAFVTNDKCYHVACYSNELCLPEKANASQLVSMVLVKPADEENWEDLIDQQDPSKVSLDNIYDILSDRNHFDSSIYKDLLMDDSSQNNLVSCEVGIDTQCLSNEFCAPQNPKSRSGICQCKTGFVRNEVGDCLLMDAAVQPDFSEDLIDKITESNNSSMPVTKKHLIIKAEPKEVRFPEDKATLIATVFSEDLPQENYQFDWTSLQKPDGSTAVQHKNGGKLDLEKLMEGVYSFKVSASTTDSYGETFVNVTVLPAKRINTPPTIIITPSNQTIKLPNSAAVLDASSSKDDDGIVAWHWELQQGPLGYEPQLKDSPTLQLNDLTKPGNYTFKLTVTDTDKATTSGTANITVLAGTDYPPEANAGEDKVIYLPHNSITLSGNLSTDDHAITTWEWTKSPDDVNKAVDMQDTRTPYLQLSNLQEGIYSFTLKVTDSANQSSNAQVHVFVKPPTNKPPVAIAGSNQTISLPQTWVVVDASASSDDNKITEFKWELLEGPSSVTFVNFNSSKTNVTGLTKGVYTFKVSVTDDNKNVASDKVYVTVNQNKNQKPNADAGEDFVVELPQNVVFLNGSKSKDDWAVVKYKWSRADDSLAIGYVAENTDNSPVLILTDVAPGKYIFNLTVYDEQGLSDTDQVTFIVKNDPRLLDLVDVTIDANAKLLTESQYQNLKAKLSLLVNDGSKLMVRKVRPDFNNGKAKATITFYVEKGGKALKANDVVRELRQKLNVDAGILGFIVTNLRTFICQNNCSGHGKCDEMTRLCICEAFWMPDLFKVYLKSDEDSDCSWSILYVVLGAISGMVAFLGCLWGVAYLCYSWCLRRRGELKPTTYKLIEDSDDLPPFASRKVNISDSDTDSDVVFESRSKPPRYSDLRNGHKPSRNSGGRLGRRVKT